LINASDDVRPDYLPPDFGSTSDKPSDKLISSLNESSESLDASFIPVCIPPRMIYDMTRGSKNMNAAMRGEMVHFSELMSERDCSLNQNYLTDADLAEVQKEVRKKNKRWLKEKARQIDQAER